jgi:DNA-binding transcriptional LysR family regulator
VPQRSLAQRKKIPLAGLAERGLGVAIVPASVPRDRPDLHAVDFVRELRGRLVLAWRATGPVSPAAS